MDGLGWLIDWLIDLFTHCLLAWLIHSFIVRLIDLFVDLVSGTFCAVTSRDPRLFKRKQIHCGLWMWRQKEHFAAWTMNEKCNNYEGRTHVCYSVSLIWSRTTEGLVEDESSHHVQRGFWLVVGNHVTAVPNNHLKQKWGSMRSLIDWMLGYSLAPLNHCRAYDRMTPLAIFASF